MLSEGLFPTLSHAHAHAHAYAHAHAHATSPSNPRAACPPYFVLSARAGLALVPLALESKPRHRAAAATVRTGTRCTGRLDRWEERTKSPACVEFNLANCIGDPESPAQTPQTIAT